jgi:hypothetical protein
VKEETQTLKGVPHLLQEEEVDGLVIEHGNDVYLMFMMLIFKRPWVIYCLLS